MAAMLEITGNIGSISEMRTTKTGKPAVTISVAHTPRARNQQGEWVDAGETLWVRGTLYGEDAEWLNRARPKGRVTLKGEPEMRTYTTNNGGQGTSLEIKFTEISFPLGAITRWGQQPTQNTQQQPTMQPTQPPQPTYNAPQGGAAHDPWAVNTQTEMPPF